MPILLDTTSGAPVITTDNEKSTTDNGALSNVDALDASPITGPLMTSLAHWCLGGNGGRTAKPLIPMAASQQVTRRVASQSRGIGSGFAPQFAKSAASGPQGGLFSVQ